jgi:hypothetical protein
VDTERQEAEHAWRNRLNGARLRMAKAIKERELAQGVLEAAMERQATATSHYLELVDEFEAWRDAQNSP